MTMGRVILLFAFCLTIGLSPNLGGHSVKRNQASRIFSYVKSRVPNACRVPNESLGIDKVAGHYTDLPPGMHSLGFNDLYLFPDETYFYIEWTDVFPTTITDKGNWAFNDDLIELHSDKSLPNGESRRNGKYLPLYIDNNKRPPMLLLGTGGDFSYFKKNAKTNDEFMLILCAYNRKEDFGSSEFKQSKREIYEKFWRPERLK
jgi:hypothetical protein